MLYEAFFCFFRERISLVVIILSNNSIDSCFAYIRNAFCDCSDFNSRRICFEDKKLAYLLNLGSYTDRDYISESLIMPLIKHKVSPKKNDEIYGLFTSSELSEISCTSVAIEKLLSGFAVLLIQTENDFSIFCAQVKRVAARSVSEPDSEVVVKGPREGFIENSEDNLALLRKRLKTTKFKSIRVTAGNYTDTTIYIAYVDSIADKNTVENIKSTIENISIPGVIDSGYIEHFLSGHSPSLLKNAGVSEKPDVVAAKLLEGRVAIICDGSPGVITVPYLFIESLQSAEDYLKTPLYATFMRFIRLVSLLLSLYFPSLYLAMVEHHTSVIPYKLYKTIITLRQDVPFGVFGELLTVLFIFELIREVGIRMPRAVGDAVGIVAGLILGDAAISAGLASAPVIMVASLTAVCTFIIPDFMNSIVLIRFANLFLAKMFGFLGIIVSFVFIATTICSHESFGIAFFSPFSPIKPKGLTDAVVTLPKRAIKHSTSAIYTKKDQNND